MMDKTIHNTTRLPLSSWRWLTLLMLTMSIACEKAIHFEPRDAEPKLVVEGVIEDDRYPVVYLSRSLNFFSTVSIDSLALSFVRNAEVFVDNGSSRYQLKEYQAPLTEGYFLYYYTADSANLSHAFRGEQGKAYTLMVKADGKEYTAHTTIPKLRKTVDSLYYMENVDVEDSGRVVLYGKFSDPPGLGDYSRYFTSVNGGQFYPGFASVYDDQVIDGKSYKVQIEQGVNRNVTVDFEEYSYFRKGDTISVKFCNIDKGVFDFWRTMEYSYTSIGNPFSSPTKVIGNVSNGALGYFGGYAVQYAHIIIPE